MVPTRENAAPKRTAAAAKLLNLPLSSVAAHLGEAVFEALNP
jgi:hypothetical protein